MQIIKDNKRNIHTFLFKVKNIYLHLLTLRARWLETNQLTIKELSVLIIVCTSVLRKHGVKLLVSSTNNMKRDSIK